MSVKILLLGNTGQLGWELERSLQTLGRVTAFDYPQINMANADSIKTVVQSANPNLIINATAYTNVDKAESEPDLAMAINGTGPGVLASEAKKLGAALIHFSTDYVFDGTKGEPYNEEDQPNPLNVYGRTKLAGEKAVAEVDGAYLTFRTSWVYSLRRPCFVTKVLEWASQNETLRIVDDQISSPTWARTLAEATAQITAQGRKDPVGYVQQIRGLYHLTDAGPCSRFEWAKAILDLYPEREALLAKAIVPAKSDEFPSPVQRPNISVLSLDKFAKVTGLEMPAWEDSLKLAMEFN